MIRNRKTYILAAAAAACWLFSACSAPLTMTASNSITPVMFGPARTLGTATAHQEPSPVAGCTTFHHRETTLTFVVVLAAGYNGVAVAGSETSTDPAGDDESGPDWSANLRGEGNPARLDWRVFRATGENPRRRVELASMRCAGFNSFFLFGILSQNHCALEGIVPAAE